MHGSRRAGSATTRRPRRRDRCPRALPLQPRDQPRTAPLRWDRPARTSCGRRGRVVTRARSSSTTRSGSTAGRLALAATSATFAFSSSSPAARRLRLRARRAGRPGGRVRPVSGRGGHRFVFEPGQGEHTFRVRALTDGGTPLGEAPRRFVVDTVAPDGDDHLRPGAVIRETNAVFAFTSSDPQARFDCTPPLPGRGALDDQLRVGRGTRTTSSKALHGFEIAAIDPAGNVGTASRTVRVDTVAPAPVVPRSPTRPRSRSLPSSPTRPSNAGSRA